MASRSQLSFRRRVAAKKAWATRKKNAKARAEFVGPQRKQISRDFEFNQMTPVEQMRIALNGAYHIVDP